MKKGFTLVELLIVATIIALLAGIGVGSYNSLSKQSRDTRRRADLENIRAALEFYRSENGNYPNALSGNKLPDLVPDYLKSNLADPKPSQNYIYCPTNSGGVNIDYVLCAHMESGSSTGDANCGSCGICGSDALSCNYKLTPLGEE